MKAILYTIARDKSGTLIKANAAEKGNEYFCPVCDTELILRKSGKTGKGTKRPHYAHRALTPNCTPETALHYLFKNLLGDKIKQHITSQTPLPISWECKYCYDRHSGNLLKKATSVRVEHNLTICQPDIALFATDGSVFAVIEVVVTHKPEESVLKFYNENNIILIQINLTSDVDIENLDSKIANPDFVATCFNPKCKRCGQYQQKTKMTVIDGPCWKCGAKMKVAMVHGTQLSGGSHIGPDRFTKKEIEFATSKGVLIRKQYSRTVNQKYLANTCTKCGTFVGDHYLFTSYCAPAAYGELPSTEYEIGFHCNHRKREDL